MADYVYNQVLGGYRWNVHQRCKYELGLEPLGLSDVQIDGAFKTVLTFSRDLSVAEKTLLDALMAGNPSLPPTPTGTRFKVDDLWEKLSAFRTATGVQWRLYFSESTLGSGVLDTIELHAHTALGAPLTLTNAQKNTAKNSYTALIREG